MPLSQIDRIEKDSKNRYYQVKIGNSMISSRYLASNTTIDNFSQNRKCVKCSIPVDFPDDSLCDYCKRLLIGDEDEV